jgi:hypothetical protein
MNPLVQNPQFRADSDCVYVGYGETDWEWPTLFHSHYNVCLLAVSILFYEVTTFWTLEALILIFNANEN